jgi:hypothetical protein
MAIKVRSQRLSLPWRICLVVLLVCAVLFAVLLIQIIRNAGGTSNFVVSPNAMPLVGTWVASSGPVINLRADGTARSRRPQEPNAEIRYFEWDVENGSLVVIMAAEPQEHYRRVLHAIFGATSIHYEITSMSATEMSIVDSMTGDVVSFTSTNDSILESAE